MQGLAVFCALLATGAGFRMGGLLGALTGFATAVGVGSGLAILLAEQDTGVASEQGATRTAQRIGGLVAAIACGYGAFHGGWKMGSLWAIGGFLVGMLFSVFTQLILGKFGKKSPSATEENQ